MNCLVIDDNKIARTTMRQLVSQVPDLAYAGEASDATEAASLLLKGGIDLLLLDIEMPGLSGIDLVRNLGEKRPLIIFTTSKKEYAAEAFDLNVVDYLVKPVTPLRFRQAIEKAREWQQASQLESSTAPEGFLFIREANTVKRLEVAEILYAEAMGDFVKLHTAQKYHIIHNTLKAVEERLPASLFLRVHRSYVVQVGKIDAIRDGALVINQTSVPVADAYRAQLNRRLRIL
ncbi:LytR/AlgR family response regulator transcription factor [Flavihumibacter petaseus]|uniref:Putative two-component response regulator n=1 Tax=Flavihumibacter petaseus NBRC 106054 TaxID=1220578 RepID=A0A0E9MVA7_9BACT|nr:LytTR family DNA-binding domain-containing protein [Flavihumibacter petaseus]GAO41065.1 putative two-component response regulator [Flavihumibacter petaseus NBRC 106054]